MEGYSMNRNGRLDLVRKITLALIMTMNLFAGGACAKEDIVVDFGGIGLWARMNDASWLKLNNSSPEQAVLGDLDGNGEDDVIAAFSAFGGIFVKRNLGGWSQISTLAPQSMSVGDLDGNGKDDIVIDFGAIGLWARMNDAGWLKLNNASPGQMAVADMDGNGQDDVIAYFSLFGGIFVKANLGGWTKLHNTAPEAMRAGDLDQNSQDDLVIDFGGLGLWARMNNISWSKLNNNSPDAIATGDLDGNGSADVLASFASAPGGSWQKLNLGGWTQLNANAADSFATGDVDGSGGEDIVADFASSLGGIFVRRNQGAWSKLHNSAPQALLVGNLDTAVALPTLSINDRTVSESAGTAVFTVSLSAASTELVTVDVSSSNGTAVAGTDFSAVNQTLSYSPGTTSRTIDVPIVNDAVNEGTETFSLALGNASNATILDAIGVATILDDDAASVVDKSSGIDLRVRPTAQDGVVEVRWTVSSSVLSQGANDFTLQYYVGGGTQWLDQVSTDEPTENGFPVLLGGVPDNFCFRMVATINATGPTLGSGTSGNKSPCL
jgi:hypothetical protein